jgi:hypothetical protein
MRRYELRRRAVHRELVPRSLGANASTSGAATKELKFTSLDCRLARAVSIS